METAASVSEALVASFTTIGSNLTSVIADIIPIALPVIGMMLVVSLGVKAFKSITRKA